MEHALSEVLGNLLFGSVQGWHCGKLHISKPYLEALFFENKSVTLDSKRHLLISALESSERLEPQKIKELDRNIRKVMDWRNAFAHGRIRFKGEKVYLAYFKNGLKQEELTDDFYTKIESYFWGAYNEAFNLLGIVLGWLEPVRAGFWKTTPAEILIKTRPDDDKSD